jgi:hypothetical protein
MSATKRTSSAKGSQPKKSRTSRVVPVEGARWTSLAGRMTPQQRDAALRSVAAKMR